MADELIDVLNKDGSFSGKTLMKSVVHREGLWHASVQVWIYTFKGEVLLQKRAPNKDTYPNLWDISVAGHLTAGDSAANAALREIKEEIGLELSKGDLQFLKTNKVSKQPSDSILDNEFNHMYLVSYPVKIDKLTLQVEEVADVKLIPIKEFQKELRTNYNDYVPHGSDYYKFIIKAIQTNLTK